MFEFKDLVGSTFTTIDGQEAVITSVKSEDRSTKQIPDKPVIRESEWRIAVAGVEYGLLTAWGIPLLSLKVDLKTWDMKEQVISTLRSNLQRCDGLTTWRIGQAK